ncbi:MAG: transglycosylase SLT domain-containing protein [Nitrospiraceae bacterium]|nr:transglycosylase SLT domain-containing protein [Nitrospiraceae bacterium]
MSSALLAGLFLLGALPGAEPYVAARSAERAGRYAQAQASFAECEAMQGPLAPYARLGAIRCVAGSGDRSGAIAAYGRFLDQADQGEPWTRMAQLYLALSLADEDDHAKAVVYFGRALSIDARPRWLDRYEWQAAESYVQVPDTATVGSDYLSEIVMKTWWRSRRTEAGRLLAKSPALSDQHMAAWAFIKSAERAEARKLLLQLAPSGDEWLRLAGLVTTKAAGLDASARSRLDAMVRSHGGDRWLRLCLGYLARNLTMNGKTDSAALVCDLLVTAYPQTEEAVLGLWWLARRLRDDEKVEEATAQFLRLAKHAPGHTLADDALLAAGVLQRDAGHPKKAIATFTRLAESYPNGEWDAQAWYWAGGLRAKAGAKKKAEVCYRRSAGLDTGLRVGNFYAHRAIEVLHTAGADVAGAGVRVNGADPFLRAFAVPPRAEPEDGLPESVRRSAPFERLAFLGSHGYEEAEWEALDLAEALKLKLLSGGVYRFLGESGLAATAMDFAALFDWGEREGAGETRTPARLRVDYPRAYWGTLRALCKEAGIDPYLVLAVARQESAFRPNVRSHAGATGVMQVMPPTAKWLVKVDPNIDAAHLTDLKHPGNSLRLGTYYLVRMIERSDGNLVYALASYNAGPGNCDKWRRRYPDAGLETFIESIPFSETRNYVKAVLGNYAAYRSLYGPGE